MNHVYTIEIDGTPRKYKNISFDSEMGLAITEFVAVVEYSLDIAEAGFKYVAIKNNGTLEWAGFLESAIPYWDDKGLFLECRGRSLSVLLWKKWNDRYSDTRTEGFFGSVDPAKLMLFMLRCPISDNVALNYTNQQECEANYGTWDIENQACYLKTHKTGYGIDTTNWICSSNRTADGRTPTYVKSRIMGFAWALGESVMYPHLGCETLTNITKEFDDVGNGYLGDLDDNTAIRSNTISPFTNNIKLTADATAGDNHIHVNSVTGLQAGDEIVITGMDVNYIIWGFYNQYYVLTREVKTIDYIDGTTIYLTENITTTVLYNITATGVYVTKRNSSTQEYYTFQDGASDTVNLSRIDLIIKGKLVFDVDHMKFNEGGYTGDTASNEVTIYLDVGSGWVEVTEHLSWTEFYASYRSLDITSYISSLSELNALRIKIVAHGDFTSTAYISRAYISFDGESFQDTDDYFSINLGASKDRVCGIYIECRSLNGSDKFARNYAIETSTNGSSWTSRATATGNQARDIIESWSPVTCQYVRIRITSPYSAGWEISQIYIYQADNRKYCIFNDGSGTLLGPYLSSTTNFGNYIGSYGTIAPMNISFGRLNDAIQDIIDNCHDNNYDIWDAWIDIDTQQFHFGERQGSDKSSTLSFIKGDNIGSVSKNVDQRKATSRVKIVGKAESKITDEITSDFIANTDAENELNTFYETIISSKRISSKIAANVMANVESRANGYPERIIEVPITNDPYTERAYVVGDDITLTDSLTGLTGAYWLKKYHKDIDENGESIIFYVAERDTANGRASKWKDISDELAKTRKQLREVGIGNTVIEDWLADGANANKIDVEKVTNSWNKDAKNEEQFAPKSNTDPAWYISGTGTLNPVSGQAFICYDQWFVTKGSKVAMGGGTLRAYSKNKESDSVTDESTPNISYNLNPKFIADLKIFVSGSNPNTDATSWRDGDNLFIGMGETDFESYFGFIIMTYQEEYRLYMTYKKYNDAQSVYLRAVQDVDGSPIYLQENTKYRLGATVDWETLTISYFFNNKLIGILPIDSTFATEYVFPIFINLITANGTPVTNWAQAYIYKFNSQWEWTS